jgi:hypothetical protein
MLRLRRGPLAERRALRRASTFPPSTPLCQTRASPRQSSEQRSRKRRHLAVRRAHPLCCRMTMSMHAVFLGHTHTSRWKSATAPAKLTGTPAGSLAAGLRRTPTKRTQLHSWREAPQRAGAGGRRACDAPEGEVAAVVLEFLRERALGELGAQTARAHKTPACEHGDASTPQRSSRTSR